MLLFCYFSTTAEDSEWWCHFAKNGNWNKTKSCINNWNSDWKWEILFALLYIYKWNFLAQCLSFTSPYDNCHKITDLIRGSCFSLRRNRLQTDYQAASQFAMQPACHTGCSQTLGWSCDLPPLSQASLNTCNQKPKQDICHLALDRVPILLLSSSGKTNLCHHPPIGIRKINITSSLNTISTTLPLTYPGTNAPLPLMFSFPSISLLCSFRLSSLRCCITIMASCDDDVLSSGMEMQHATVHIIKAECIRCHLCGNMAARSLCVKLFCGKQKERESDGELYFMQSAVKVFYCWRVTNSED